MLRNLLITTVTIFAAAMLYLFWPKAPVQADYTQMQDITLIAHAGGGLPQGTYSNAREAFDLSAANGFSLIEADFNWTRDGQLVLMHDWQTEHIDWFSPVQRVPKFLKISRFTQAKSANAFTSRKMRGGLTAMALDDLLQWMRDHPDVQIVTDIKGNNIEGLKQIATKAPEMRGQFIAQIYSPEDYGPAYDLGFSKIIFTAYRSPLNDKQLASFAASHTLYALTVPAGRVSQELTDALRASSTPVFAHTINTPQDAQLLLDKGVKGIYTDYIIPAA